MYEERVLSVDAKRCQDDGDGEAGSLGDQACYSWKISLDDENPAKVLSSPAFKKNFCF